MDQKNSESLTPIAQLLKEIETTATNVIAQNQFQKYPEHAWWHRTPDKWILQIMASLRISAVNVMNYGKFRKGLVDAAADITIAIRRADELEAARMMEKEYPPEPKYHDKAGPDGHPDETP